MKKLLLLAIFLRLLLSAFYFHPDIKTFNFQSSFLRKGVFNIYSYLKDNKESLTLKDEFVYFPLTYFTLGGYQAVASPILGSGFDKWLSDADSSTMVRTPGIFKYLIVLKIPYLIIDIAIAFLLIEFFKDPKNKKKAFVFWLFNPFTIILIYVFGNIDIFPVALTLGAFLLLKKQKPFAASLLLGLASGFKLYPLLFIPFLFLWGRNTKEKILLSLIPLAMFGLICLLFISPAFFQSALVSGLSTGIFRSELTVLVISLLFFYAAFLDKKINLFNYWIALFIIIFSFSSFHVQWLFWVTPFIVILIVKKPILFPIIFLISLAAFAIPIFYEDRFMTLGLMRIYSTLYDLLPTPFVVLQKFYDPYNFRDVLHSVMAGGAMVLIYKVFRKEV